MFEKILEQLNDQNLLVRAGAEFSRDEGAFVQNVQRYIDEVAPPLTAFLYGILTALGPEAEAGSQVMCELVRRAAAEHEDTKRWLDGYLRSFSEAHCAKEAEELARNPDAFARVGRALIDARAPRCKLALAAPAAVYGDAYATGAVAVLGFLARREEGFSPGMSVAE